MLLDDSFRKDIEGSGAVLRESAGRLRIWQEHSQIQEWILPPSLIFSYRIERREIAAPCISMIPSTKESISPVRNLLPFRFYLVSDNTDGETEWRPLPFFSDLRHFTSRNSYRPVQLERLVKMVMLTMLFLNAQGSVTDSYLHPEHLSSRTFRQSTIHFYLAVFTELFSGRSLLHHFSKRSSIVHTTKLDIVTQG
ncbi:hypothetical protein ABKN59_003550 [Abortiporus biennis]